MKEAKKFGCKTIAHSHSAGYRGNRFEQTVKRLFTIDAKKQADYWFACSKPAAVRLFGKDYLKYEHYYDIPNAIIAENYLFDDERRNKIRNELGVKPNQKLYGHVGSFTSPKNHDFLLEVFSKISSNDPGAMMVLCGEGERKNEIQDKIRSLDLTGKVILVGNISIVNEDMMAMDTMIFPSYFEGFPITVLEAQATGLPIVLSDTITDEVFLTDCVYPFSLSRKSEEWAEMCMKVQANERCPYNSIIAKTKFNMSICVETLMKIYKEMVN